MVSFTRNLLATTTLSIVEANNILPQHWQSLKCQAKYVCVGIQQLQEDSSDNYNEISLACHTPEELSESSFFQFQGWTEKSGLKIWFCSNLNQKSFVFSWQKQKPKHGSRSNTTCNLTEHDCFVLSSIWGVCFTLSGLFNKRNIAKLQNIALKWKIKTVKLFWLLKKN